MNIPTRMSKWEDGVYLTCAEIAEIYGIKNTPYFIGRAITDKTIPQPVKIRGRVTRYWKLGDVRKDVSKLP